MTLLTLGAATDAVQAFMRDNPHLTEFIVFLLGIGEGIALISLFVPSTILFLGIGGIHSAAGGEFWPVWLAASAGACLGDCVSYGLGRYFKSEVGRVWPISKYPEILPKGRALFQRWGMSSIIGGKFVGALRPFLPLVAGMLDMPWALFLAASAVSSLIWAATFLGPGYGIGFLLQ
jgi:membrane protein DedA with SNARE-associated domain